MSLFNYKEMRDYMITVEKIGGVNGEGSATLYGKSEDTKPTLVTSVTIGTTTYTTVESALQELANRVTSSCYNITTS